MVPEWSSETGPGSSSTRLPGSTSTVVLPSVSKKALSNIGRTYSIPSVSASPDILLRFASSGSVFDHPGRVGDVISIENDEAPSACSSLNLWGSTTILISA